MIQATLLAEKYGSGTRPVLAVMAVAVTAFWRRASIMGAVRRHCHTMALHSGSPVVRSHTRVVSRWLVMPMESTSAVSTLHDSKSSVRAPSWVDRMSCGSCSTQPGCGYIWRKGRCTRPTMPPLRSTSMARDDVVP